MHHNVCIHSITVTDGITNDFNNYVAKGAINQSYIIFLKIL